MEHSKITPGLRQAIAALDAAYLEVKFQLRLLDEPGVPSDLTAPAVIKENTTHLDSIAQLEGTGVEEHGVTLVAADYLVYDFDPGGQIGRPDRKIVIAPFIDGKSDPAFFEVWTTLSNDPDLVGLVSDTIAPGLKRPSSWTSRPNNTVFEVLAPIEIPKTGMTPELHQELSEMINKPIAQGNFNEQLADSPFYYPESDTVEHDFFIIEQGGHKLLGAFSPASAEVAQLDEAGQAALIDAWPAHYREAFHLTEEVKITTEKLTLNLKDNLDQAGHYKIDTNSLQVVEVGDLDVRLFKVIEPENK